MNKFPLNCNTTTWNTKTNYAFCQDLLAPPNCDTTLKSEARCKSYDDETGIITFELRFTANKTKQESMTIESLVECRSPTLFSTQDLPSRSCESIHVTGKLFLFSRLNDIIPYPGEKPWFLYLWAIYVFYKKINWKKWYFLDGHKDTRGVSVYANEHNLNFKQSMKVRWLRRLTFSSDLIRSDYGAVPTHLGSYKP